VVVQRFEALSRVDGPDDFLQPFTAQRDRLLVSCSRRRVALPQPARFPVERWISRSKNLSMPATM
jgi:hypothetical protein